MFAKLILAATMVVGALARTAQMTWYSSYPRCCYDPRAPREECDKYNGCMWAGQFANGETLTLEQVKNTPIVSFFDAKNKSQTQWRKLYMNKKIRITKNGVTFIAQIKDTCSDDDVSGGANTCTQNSKGGYLIDIEEWTARKYLGSTSKADGTVQFEFI